MNINNLKIVFLCLGISLFYSCQNNTDNTQSEKQNEAVKVNEIKSNKENVSALLLRPNSLKLNLGNLSNLELVKGFRSLQLGKEIDELYFPLPWYSHFPYQNRDSIIEYTVNLGESVVVEDVTLSEVVLTFMKGRLVKIEFEPWTLNEGFVNQYINLYGKPNVKNKKQFYSDTMDEDESYNSQVHLVRYKSEAECERAVRKITPENISMIWQYKNIQYTIEQRFKYRARKNHVGKRFYTGVSQSRDPIDKDYWAIQCIEISNTIKIELIDEMKQVEKIYSALSKAMDDESKKEKDSLAQKAFNNM